MLHEILLNELKKNFYIVHESSYSNKTSKRELERYICKHKLLKPELIIVNNQPYGFKRIKKSLLSLEEFPIQCEIEWFEEDDEIVIESFELLSEIKTTFQDKSQSFQTLCKKFKSNIHVEYSQSINGDLT